MWQYENKQVSSTTPSTPTLPTCLVTCNYSPIPPRHLGAFLPPYKKRTLKTSTSHPNAIYQPCIGEFQAELLLIRVGSVRNYQFGWTRILELSLAPIYLFCHFFPVLSERDLEQYSEMSVCGSATNFQASDWLSFHVYCSKNREC